MREYYNNLTEEQKEIFTKGRESVLDDFDTVCLADAFIGFNTEEWKAVKKFFKLNRALTNTSHE